MSADPDLTDLDARGRAAAAGLRAAAEERPVPRFDPDLLRIDVDAPPVPPARRRRWEVVAVAAVVLLVVAAAAVALRVGGDAEGPTDRVGTQAPGRHVLGEVPEGLALLQVVEVDADTAPDAGVSLDSTATVYGPSEDDPRVAVAVLPDAPAGDGTDPEVATTEAATGEAPEPPDDGTPPQVQGLEEITVAGRRGWDLGLGGGAVVVADGDAPVVVIGSGGDVEAVAGAVAADGAEASVPDAALPEGWRVLGEVPLVEALGAIGALGGGEEGGFVVVYAPDGPEADESFAQVTLDTRAGGALEVGLPALLAGEGEVVEVHGAPAVLARRDGGSGVDLGWWTVSWQERPGEVVRLTATDDGGSFTRDEVLAMAEGVRRIAPEEVDGLRQEAARHGIGSGGLEEVGSGTFSDGTPWTMVVDPSDTSPASLSLRTAAPSTGSAAIAEAVEAGPDGEPGADTSALPGGVTVAGSTAPGAYGWAYGAASDDVASVEVRDADGTVLAEATLVASGPVRGWVAEVPGGVPLAEPARQASAITVVALAADGSVLQELSF